MTNDIFLYILSVSVIFAGAMGCASVSGAPIYVGMSKSDVTNNYNFFSEEHIVAGPGLIAKGYNIIVDNNVKLTLLFDDKGYLFRIFTSESSFHLDSGIGVKSTFAEVKKIYLKFDVSFVMGFGKFVECENGVRLGFPWKEPTNEILDNESVMWIEFSEFKPIVSVVPLQ